MGLSSIINFLTMALGLISELFGRKNAEKDRVWERILDARKRLSDALGEGRISDVPAIKAELEELEKEYKRLRVTPNGAEVLVPALLASAALMSGCITDKPENPHTAVLVEGSRILLVEPGRELLVPELEKPARQWYLVDDIALLHWLGVSVSGSE